MGLLAAACLACLLFLGIAAPVLWGETAVALHPAALDQGPSLAHLLGTDALGRDVLARSLVAVRLSLIGAAVAAVTAGVIGTCIGALVGLSRGAVHFAGNRVIDAFLAIPDILIAIVIVVILGKGLIIAAVAIGIANWPFFGRITSSLVAQIRDREFVKAATVLGVRRRRLILRYILPNTTDTLVAAGTLAVSGSLLSLSAISFLGFGVQPPAFDLGTLIAAGLQSVYEQPLLTLAPAALLVFAGLTIGVSGDALAREINPLLATGQPVSGARRWHGPSPSLADASPPSPAPSNGDSPLLDVRGMTVTVGQGLTAVRGVDITVYRAERVGIVGESGSGKTLTLHALARLLRPPVESRTTVFRFDGREVSTIPRRELRTLFGRHVAMVFQDPLSSLNPVLRIVTQMTEAPRHHLGLSMSVARRRAADGLAEVWMRSPLQILRAYPHELSGGMQQRTVLAMGLGVQPDLLLADEPTTALDVTVQAQLIRVLRAACDEHSMALILVSHNIGVIAEVCDRILVMYAGRVVEELPTSTLRLGGARHPYTQALIAAMPQLVGDARPTPIPGEPADAMVAMAGCRFADRCPLVQARCRREEPALLALVRQHRAACWVAQGTAADE